MPLVRRLEELVVITNNDITPELAFAIEQEVFPEEFDKKLKINSKKDIEFLLKYGIVNITIKPKGIAESIMLRDLLGADLGELPLNSNIRMILENDRKYGTLNSIRADYPCRASYHYAYRIGMREKGRGYGSRFFAEWAKILIKDENDLMFGFVRAEPPNIPSLRMCLRNGTVIDQINDNVYGPGRSYFRFVLNGKVKTNTKDTKIVLLDNPTYLSEITGTLAEGYIGTRVDQPNTLVFSQRL